MNQTCAATAMPSVPTEKYTFCSRRMGSAITAPMAAAMSAASTIARPSGSPVWSSSRPAA
jgi:hypothetical protein